MQKQNHNHTIVVRDFTVCDSDVFLALANEFYSSPAVCHSVPQRHIELTFNECLSDSPFARGFILECDGSPAGFALLSFMHSLESGGRVVLLEDLYVQEAFRGKGIVSAFFKKLFAEYDSKVTRYKLEVTKDNTNAIDIYKHYGFEILEYIEMVKEMPKG